MEEDDNLETLPQQSNQNSTDVVTLGNDSKQTVSTEIQSSTKPTTSNEPKGNTSSDGAGEVVKPVSAKEKNPKKM